MTNTILRHRYKILSELGKGGFGTTYLATDIDLPNHSECVVKQLAPSDPRPEVFKVAKTLFKKEAITLQRLGEHNQIPRLFAYFEERGQFYLVQEFIEGNDLTKEIHSEQKITEEEAIQLLTEILEVLRYVHQQNVIHRDLKPQNIMRRKDDGKIVLIDFGAVKEIKGLTVTTGGHTTHTIAVGTPGYMPGEQAAGQPRFCSDIYAVGMMTIEALIGMPASRLTKDLSTGELIWKNQVNVSEKLTRILDKMVADYWRNRYQTIDEVMVELTDNNYADNQIQQDYGNNKSQQETVLIDKNQLSNEESTVLVSNNQQPNDITSCPQSFTPPPLPSIPPQARVKIGLGIVCSAILASIIIPNISKQIEINIHKEIEISSPSPSPTVNAQNLETYSPSPSPTANAQYGEKLLPPLPPLNTRDGEKLLPPPLPPLNARDGEKLLPPRPPFNAQDGEKLPLPPRPPFNAQEGETFSPSITRNTISYGTNISQINTLTGHRDWIRSVAISPDGQTIVSSSYDRTIKVWDLATGSLKRTLSGNSAQVVFVTISPDGQTIFSGNVDGTIKVWDLATGTLKSTLTGHTNSVYSLAISPDGQTFVSSSADGTIKVWDLASGSLKNSINAHSNAVYSVAVSPDGKTIVSGSGDRRIKVWDLASGSLKNSITAHNNQVFSVAISPDGQTVVSGGADGTIKVWDLASGSLKKTLTGHGKDVWSVAISSDGKTIVSGSEDNTIKVWDLATGSLKETLTGHQWVVTSVAISADGQNIISGSDDKTIKVWGQ